MIKGMQSTINLYKQLFLLKISPEALPYSQGLLRGLILIYFIINVGIFASTGRFIFSDNLLAHTGAVLLGILFLYGALKVKGQLVRLHKLLLAIFGTDVFFLIISLMMHPLNIDIQLIVAFACLLWSLSIKTHIFSKGFNLKTPGAILLMIGFEFVRHIPTAILIWPYLQKQA